MTSSRWTVPATFVANRADDRQREWARSLAGVAAGLGEEWSLEPAGDPMWGYVSVVWPVRGPAGEQWVLKVGEDDPRNVVEGAVLLAWQSRGAVEVVRHDATTGALLLEALDPARDLESVPDETEATAVVGGFIANLKQVPAPGRCAALHRRAPAHPRATCCGGATWLSDGLTTRDFDVALDTLATAAADLDAAGPWPAMHGDLHYCNVLHTRDGAADPGWRVIDPLPMLGPAEAEVIAPMRNRWEDAVATGDPGRALRRRLDQLVDLADLDTCSSPRRCATPSRSTTSRGCCWRNRSRKTGSWVPIG